MSHNAVDVNKIKNEKIGALRTILEERDTRKTMAVSIPDKEWDEEQLRINKVVGEMLETMDISDTHGIIYVHEVLEIQLNWYTEELKRKLVYENVHGVPLTEALDGLDRTVELFRRMNKFLDLHQVTKTYLILLLLMEKVPVLPDAKLQAVRRTAGQLFISAAIDKDTTLANAASALSAAINSELRKRIQR
jgi:hypothetical protein